MNQTGFLIMLNAILRWNLLPDVKNEHHLFRSPENDPRFPLQSYRETSETALEIIVQGVQGLR
jgi:hypothetical protein